MKERNKHIVRIVGVNFCRFLLAAVFTFSGFVKVIDPLGFQYKIEEYLTAFGMASWIPSFFPLWIGIALSVLELSTGLLLFLGIRRIISSTLALLIMLFMTPLSLYLLIFNPVTDCGCFGDAWVLTHGETFVKNLILLAATLPVFRWRKDIIRFLTPGTEWLVSMYILIFGVSLSVYCLNHLPVLDFRPYSIGQNIPEGMTIPEGAQPNVYETVFILEKDGKRQEFSLDNYPDSTWTFIDSRTTLKVKGYEPPIHDFALIEATTGEDITEEILTDNGYTFLLIVHRTEQADDSNIDLINEIYDYSVEHKYAFYCLTASSEEEIALWRDRTGAEYPFCRADGTTLKTIIRSNPGLLLLKNGTILNKWSDEDLPDEYVLSAPLEDLPIGRPKAVDESRIIGNVCLWFFLPLCLVLLLDLLIVRRREWRIPQKSEAGKYDKNE